jgi:AcrR family transcriptional regulator
MARAKPGPTIREENERALLEAAESIFAEQGFAGATTAAIARRAGVPKANLHYYFATKEGLYRAVIERLARRRLLVRRERRPGRGARSLYWRENGSRAGNAARLPDLVGGNHARGADDPGFP